MSKQFYKINLHIFEACNYNSAHCFAHFENERLLKEKEWEKIVDNCIENTNVEEFNIAGGEPLLYKDLMKLVRYIHEKGKKVSIITNGSKMSNAWIRENAKYFTTIGFSIDSFEAETLIAQDLALRQIDKFRITTMDRVDNGDLSTAFMVFDKKLRLGKSKFFDKIQIE